jgi:hypothetical protein
MSFKKQSFILWLSLTLSLGSVSVVAQTQTAVVHPQGYENISLVGVTAYDPQQLWLFAV